MESTTKLHKVVTAEQLLASPGYHHSHQDNDHDHTHDYDHDGDHHHQHCHYNRLDYNS